MATKKTDTNTQATNLYVNDGTRNKLNVVQGSEEWKNERKKYITATDVATLMSISKGKLRYGTTFNVWAEEKIKGRAKPSGFLMKIMQKGKDFEEFYSQTKIEPHINFTKSETYVRDGILASTDLIITKINDNKVEFPLEIKYTTSEESINSIKSGNKDLHYFYQLCAQMYVLGSNRGSLRVGFSKDNLGDPVIYKSFLTTDDQVYKDFLKLVPIFKDLQAQLSIGCGLEDPFVEKHVQKALKTLTNTYQEKIEEVKRLENLITEEKDKIEAVKNRVFNLIKDSGTEMLPVEVNGEHKCWKATLKTVIKKSLKPGVKKKDIYEELKLKDGIKEVDVFDFLQVEEQKVSLVNAK